MGDSDALALRRLTLDDMPNLMALVNEAGWNQTTQDWQMMLTLGNARGLADGTGHVIASALTLPHGNSLSWISMVLVAGEWRKRGCATRLLDDCIAELRDADRVAGLDATPAGQPVYQRLGFACTERMSRWRRPARAPTGEVRKGIKPAGPDDVARIAALDAEIFGAPRSKLIHDLCHRAIPMGWIKDDNGFLLHREGLNARQIGPLCASDPASAQHLLDSALAQFGEALVIDACDSQRGFGTVLAARGFVIERRFTRMYLGTPTPRGDPERLFAIAGPELG